MNKTIIVIDAQNDFLTGALANPAAVAALPTLRKVINWGVENNCNFIFTQDTHGENYLETQEGRILPVPHCIYHSKGWEIADGLVPEDNVKFVEKWQFGYERWCIQKLQDTDEIIFTGFVTDICVISNIICVKAQYPEVPITFICDAAAGLTPEKHEAACEVMRSCQVNVKTWEEYLGA